MRGARTEFPRTITCNSRPAALTLQNRYVIITVVWCTLWFLLNPNPDSES
jgi:hypothetical protein